MDCWNAFMCSSFFKKKKNFHGTGQKKGNLRTNTNNYCLFIQLVHKPSREAKFLAFLCSLLDFEDFDWVFKQLLLNLLCDLLDSLSKRSDAELANIFS